MSIDDRRTILTEILDRPVADLHATEAQVEKILTQRLEELILFTEEGTPADLRNAFIGAVELTKVCDRLCKQLLAFQKLGQDIPDLGAVERFKFASLYLSRNRENNEILPDLKLIDEKVFIIFSQWFEDKTDVDFDQFLSQNMQGEQEAYIYHAKMHAALAISLMETIEVSLFQIRAIGFIIGVCRGVFYTVIVDDSGRQLARDVRAQEIQSRLRDVGAEFFALLPGVELFMGFPLAIFDLLSTLIKRDEALKKWAGSLREKYRLAEEFMGVYSELLLAWSEWAIGINKAAPGIFNSFQQLLLDPDREQHE